MSDASVGLYLALNGRLDTLLAPLLSEAEASGIAAAEMTVLQDRTEQLCCGWKAAVEEFAADPAGELTYRDLVQRFYAVITPRLRRQLPSEGEGLKTIQLLGRWVAAHSPRRLRVDRKVLARRRRRSILSSEALKLPRFQAPIFILSAPRAGSTLLFETLSQFPEIWSTGEENHEMVESLPGLHPSACQYYSNCLTAADCTTGIRDALIGRFRQQLENRHGVAYRALDERPSQIRFLEKTPKNALRIPFIKALFPDAKFLFLHRDPRENISSLMEGWRSRRFVSYRGVAGWPYQEWSFALVPGWRTLTKASVAEVAAYQWQVMNHSVLNALTRLPATDYYLVSYQDLVEKAPETIEAISRFAGLRQDEHLKQRLAQPLPVSRLTLSEPVVDKWRQHEEEINRILPSVEAIANRLSQQQVYV